MGLATLRAQGSPRRYNGECAVGGWLDTLNEVERAEAEALIADESWPTQTLHKALRDDPDIDGYVVLSANPLIAHRKHECRCAR